MRLFGLIALAAACVCGYRITPAFTAKHHLIGYILLALTLMFGALAWYGIAS